MEMKKGYDDIYELLGELISHFSCVKAYGKVASKWLYNDEEQRTFEKNIEAIENLFKKIERICLDYLIWK